MENIDEPKTYLSPADQDDLAAIVNAASRILGIGKPAPQQGYYLKSSIFGNKAHVYLMHDGKLVSSGFSNIREPADECSVAQALSYATHMAYKHCQWKEEFHDLQP